MCGRAAGRSDVQMFSSGASREKRVTSTDGAPHRDAAKRRRALQCLQGPTTSQNRPTTEQSPNIEGKLETSVLSSEVCSLNGSTVLFRVDLGSVFFPSSSYPYRRRHTSARKGVNSVRLLHITDCSDGHIYPSVYCRSILFLIQQRLSTIITWLGLLEPATEPSFHLDSRPNTIQYHRRPRRLSASRPSRLTRQLASLDDARIPLTSLL